MFRHPRLSPALEVDDDENPIALHTERSSVLFVSEKQAIVCVLTSYECQIEKALQSWARPGKTIVTLYQKGADPLLSEVTLDSFKKHIKRI